MPEQEPDKRKRKQECERHNNQKIHGTATQRRKEKEDWHPKKIVNNVNLKVALIIKLYASAIPFTEKLKY